MNTTAEDINQINRENKKENREYRYKMSIIRKSLKAIDSRFKIVMEEDLSYLKGNIY